MIDTAACTSAAPSAWVERFLPLILPGEALDLACGRGRHTRLLAARGLRVIAADRDEALLPGLTNDNVKTISIDLEQGPSPALDALLRPARYAGIVVTNYLHRPLLPMLLDALAEGGVLIYETFGQGNAEFGKPSNPAFLLQPGELLSAVAQAIGPFQVVAYEHGFQAKPQPAVVQRLCVIRCTDALAPDAVRL